MEPLLLQGGKHSGVVSGIRSISISNFLITYLIGMQEVLSQNLPAPSVPLIGAVVVPEF